MGQLPRIAIGTIQPQADAQPVVWALLDVLSRHDRQVQHFLSPACFTPLDGASTVTGLCSRHLDSWLMTPEVCREIFFHGAKSSDLAVVEGRYSPTTVAAGGTLDPLCDWLALPRLVVLDVARLVEGHFPSRPAEIDGVLLDRMPDSQSFSRLRTIVEALWGVPVLGALGELPGIRAELARLLPGSSAPRELCRQLGQQLLENLRLEELWRLSFRKDFPPVQDQLFRPGTCLQHVRVAVAYDAAFHCYFADTLDFLEVRGATVADFSPLRDECLPPDTDIVYLGCGHPERYANELAANHCMTMALRNHVCAGRRVYAEGGGLAYLCRQIETPCGQRKSMVGALPTVARLNPHPEPPRPVETTLSSDNWLAPAGTKLRGYLNSNWLIEPSGQMIGCLAEHGQECDVACRHHAVGSRIHLDFIAQPQVIRGFLKPHAASLDWAQCRTWQ